jgi:integrase
MSYKMVPVFRAELRKQDKIAARALELLILTGTRTGEVRFARWDEFDLENRLWVIPGERMKANKPHTVPLSDQAVTLLQAMPCASDYLFPDRAKVINEKALNIVLSSQ